MTLRHYRIFTEVCKQNSMTRTAEKLHMTQPSVSQAVSELEANYGIRLFERFGKKIFLTDNGKKLLGYTSHIIDIVEKMDEDMRDGGKTGGVLKIGATVTIGTCLLGGFVRRFKDELPGVQITSVVDNTAVVEEKLLNNELDIALVEGIIKSERLISLPFAEDAMVLTAWPGHPLCRRGSCGISDLEDELFIVREKGSGTRATFEIVMTTRNVHWREAWVCNNPEAIKRAVEQGLGLTVISKLAILTELESGSLKEIAVEDAVFARKFCMVHHKDKFMTPAISKFREIIGSLRIF